jgi:predicted phosphodiesterase
MGTFEQKSDVLNQIAALKSVNTDFPKLKKNKSINIKNLRLSFSHGTPWKINQYIYPDTEKKILLKFRKLKQDIFFIGHTHRRL